MNRNHLIALVLIAVSIGAISHIGRRKYLCHLCRGREDPGQVYTVIGTLDTSRGMHYAARKNLFTFYALDKNGMSRGYCMLSPNHRISSGQKK